MASPNNSHCSSLRRIEFGQQCLHERSEVTKSVAFCLQDHNRNSQSWNVLLECEISIDRDECIEMR